MSTEMLRCERCKNYVDPEDHFCGNCGLSLPGVHDASDSLETGFIGYECDGCGASLTYDAEERGLSCSFCGSVSLTRRQKPSGRICAKSFVPLVVERRVAEERYRQWIGKGFFTPLGLAREARVVKMQAVYLPFWAFSAHADTYYTGDTSETPFGARADWCPVYGERAGEVQDVLVSASSALEPLEVDGLGAFDFARAEAYERERIRDYPVEDFGVSRRGARALAREAMKDHEVGVSAEEIPGRSRNVHVNSLFTQLRSQPVLVPVWMSAFRYEGAIYRFIVNGQTGRIVGRKPRSLARLFIVLAIVLLVLLVGLGVAAAAAALS